MIRLGDRTFAMPLHGFARGMIFEVAAASADRCRFVLSDGPATRIHYPFPFRLEIDYVLDGATLRVEARIVNTGGGILPASFGFHPGFRWPLAGGLAKTAHRLVFDADEHLDVARAQDGLILPGSTRLDLIDGALPLDEALFAQGAMVLHAPRDRPSPCRWRGATCRRSGCGCAPARISSASSHGPVMATRRALPAIFATSPASSRFPRAKPPRSGLISRRSRSAEAARAGDAELFQSICSVHQVARNRTAERVDIAATAARNSCSPA